MGKTIEIPRPWYQEFWVWVVIGLPLSVIVGCFFTVVIAFQNADAIVDENANNDPVLINQVLKKERLAKDMHLKARVSVSRQNGHVILNLEQKRDINHQETNQLDTTPHTILLKLEHPTIPQYDQSIVLNKDQEGRYHGRFKLFYSGWRYVSVIPNNGQWVLKGKMKLFTDAPQIIG